MKKLFFAAIAVAAISFASCGNQNKGAKDAVDSLADSTEVVDTTALSAETKSTINALTSQLTEVLKGKDTKALTTALANLAATYKGLVNAGKLEDALTYGQVIKNFVKTNMESIKGLAGDNAAISGLLSGIENLPTSAATTAEEAKQAVADEAIGLAAPSIQKAAAATATAEAAAAALKDVPTNAAKAVSNAVEGATDAAAAKVNEAKEKTQEAAGKAVESAKEKTGAAIDGAANAAKKGLGL